jgi:hypothetical protein
MDSYTFSRCPRCAADDIEIIPVEDYEKCSFNINKIRGIEVEFSDDRIRAKTR